MDNQRSVFALSRWDILVAILIGMVTLLGFHEILWSAEPWGYQFYEQKPTTLPGWFVEERQEVFSTCAVPLTIVMVISGVCLVRGIRRDTRYIPYLGCISPFGHFTLAWPLVFFVPIMNALLILIFLLFLALCLMVLLLSFVASAYSYKTKSNFGNFVTIPANVVMILLLYDCLVKVLILTGD